MITVLDVLKRPVFKNAQVIAGKTGLDRKIRWVHILETPEIIEKSIKGNEMILSTGYGFQSENPTNSCYLERMIENGVACLCLELVEYMKKVPQEMIDTANKYHFPIIVFYNTVHFVDITQDLHSFIIDSHHFMLKKLDVLSREFHHLTLTSKGNWKILKLLHENTKSNVVYLSVQSNQTSFVPNINDKLKSDITESIKIQKEFWEQERTNQWRHLGLNYLSQAIGALGQIWGYLILIQEREYQEFDFLILDRAATALSQDLLRKQYIEVRRLHEENVWINELINNKILNQQQVKELYETKLKYLGNFPFRICLIDIVPTTIDSSIDPLEDNETTTYMDVAVVTRTAFHENSFKPFITALGNQLVAILFDLNSGKQERKRYDSTIRQINRISNDTKVGSTLRFGVGGSYVDISHVRSSYEEAKKVLQIKNFHINLDNHFYEDLGVFRLFINSENEIVLQSFIDDYLGPVIQHDLIKGSEFLRTLKVYLEVEGSKIHTTEKLHIVRQSLYHRLEKIKELLGEDFMSSEKRLAIEVAIKIYQYLNPGVL